MPNLIELLRSSSPLIDRLRNRPVFRRVPVAPKPESAPNSELGAEITSLKQKGTPLRQVLAGLEAIGKGDQGDFAKQIYFGLAEPLTRIPGIEKIQEIEK